MLLEWCRHPLYYTLMTIGFQHQRIYQYGLLLIRWPSYMSHALFYVLTHFYVYVYNIFICYTLAEFVPKMP